MNNKKTTIYLYRHVETNWNVEDRITGQMEGIHTTFTENGIKQIQSLIEKLKENRVEIIYYSDYERTSETAKMANEKLKLPMFSSKELRGLNMGKYQGMILKEVRNIDEVKKCFLNYDLKFENGESINQLNKRMLGFIKKVCENTQYTRIAMISHSAAISNLKAYITGEKYISLNECKMLYSNGELSVIDYVLNDSKGYENRKKKE